MTQRRDIVLVVLALAFALIAGYFDQHTDDSGIMAGMIGIFGFVLGFMQPQAPWRWGVLVGLGIPVTETIVQAQNGTLHPGLGLLATALLIMAFPLAGAYLGAFLRRALTVQTS